MKTKYKSTDFKDEEKLDKLVEDLNSFIKDKNIGVNVLVKNDKFFREGPLKYFAKCFVLKKETLLKEITGGFVEFNYKVEDPNYFICAYDGTYYEEVLLLSRMKKMRIEGNIIKFTAEVDVESVIPTIGSDEFRIKESKQLENFELIIEV